MSETVKKKPDFNKLDFSKISGENVTPVLPKVPAPVEGLSSEKKSVRDGAWIYGKDIAEVTPDEFKNWLADLLPGVGVEKWEDSTINSPKDREKVILRLSNTLHRVFCFPHSRTTDEKKYIN